MPLKNQLVYGLINHVNYINKMVRRKVKNRENWTKTQKSDLVKQAQKKLNEIKKGRKGKKFKYIKHPEKGLIEVEIKDD